MGYFEEIPQRKKLSGAPGLIIIGVCMVLVVLLLAINLGKVNDETQEVETIKDVPIVKQVEKIEENQYGMIVKPTLGENGYDDLEVIDDQTDETLIEMELVGNTDHCLIDCEAIINITLYEPMELFTTLDFENKSKHKKFLDYNIYYQTEDREEFEQQMYDDEVCFTDTYSGNLTEFQNCTSEFLGNQTLERVTYDWKKYKGNEMPIGNHLFKIEGKKEVGDNIDWAFEIPGYITMDEVRNSWAWWNDTWGSRINITNITANISYINITFDAGMQTNFSDIRFLDTLQSTEFPYFLQVKNDSLWAIFRVKSDSENISMYFNSTVTSSNSDIFEIYPENLTNAWFLDRKTAELGLVVQDSAGVENGTNDGAERGILLNNKVVGKSFSFVSVNTDNVAVSQNILSGLSEFTIVAWVKTDLLDGAYDGYLYRDRPTDVLAGFNNGDWQFQVDTTSGQVFHIMTIGNFSIGNFFHVTHIYNSSDILTYINSTLRLQSAQTGTVLSGAGDAKFGSNGLLGAFFDGKFDEIMFFDKALTQQEINEVYSANEPVPIFSAKEQRPVIGPGSIVVQLVAPADLAESSTGDFNFTANYTASFINMTNATYLIWKSGILVNQTTVEMTGNLTNETTLLIENLSLGTHEWNVEACGTNATGGFCFQAASNFTFSVGFGVINQSFNALATETDNEDFFLNITTLPGILSISAKLIYNGTSSVADVSCVGILCGITDSIDIPLINAGESENKTAFWEIDMFDGTSSFSLNTSLTPIIQNVSRLHLEECNGTFVNQSLNFTAWDERNRTAIAPFSFDSTIETWLGLGGVKRNQSFTHANTNSVQLCITPANRTIFFDGIIEYDEASTSIYTARNYFFQNNSMNSTSQDIRLFLLESSESTSFILAVNDENILPFEGVLVFIERYYPGTDEFEIVQVAMTSDKGKSVGFFEVEIPEYRFTISQNNTILLQTDQGKVVGEDIPFTITFNVGVDSTSPWAPFEEVDDLDFSLAFDPQTKIVTFSYEDTSNQFISARLIVERQNFSVDNNTEVCDVIQFIDAAILSCNLSGNDSGTYNARAIITRTSGASLVAQASFNLENIQDIIGVLGVFYGIFIIMIAGFAFGFNEIAGIVTINAAVIGVNIAGLINFGPVFITALIAVSLIIIITLER